MSWIVKQTMCVCVCLCVCARVRVCAGQGAVVDQSQGDHASLSDT